MSKTKLFIVCSGLGQVNRGFESFTQECFEELSQDNSLDTTLFKGGGESFNKEVALWNLPRSKPLTIQLGKIFKLVGKQEDLGKTASKEKKDAYLAYLIEQLTFLGSFIPYLNSHQPDVILFSDANLGSLLWYWRRLTKQNYKLLFSNGSPLMPPFPRWDHVQQLTPTNYSLALEAGEPVEKHTLLPNAVSIPPELEILNYTEKQALRRELGLPEKQPLIISVGAINNSHKRMDYVIKEVSILPKPRPYLLLLGQQDLESPEIIQLGNNLLSSDNFQVRTVSKWKVPSYYKVADAFVLGSLMEGFGRVYVEAMSYGLPCLAHDYEGTKFILGNEGYLGNFELSGGLASLIPEALAESYDTFKIRRRYQIVAEQFSWDKLRPQYVKMIESCVNNNRKLSLQFA